ncbi:MULTISPECIES: thioesterase II family protein [unclassified Streptomyces]|uniref:thioesterase II family protein n=1 Tax=unclassified Streptomyces TaxID=2593676 RepID=UPI001F03D892|nr:MULTISPECIES: alpha/beta fold hydrolase [unclassified Streptomyces]MCH0564849.1 thioesterase [Streptomyces sp. MUM 2J]MCH0569877.1 thioesterase [Streptomyces sp. MUM 136J]
MQTVHPDLWIRRFHSAVPASPRLVCLPHAGGAASFYMPMSKMLSPGVEVLAIQYPGRHERLSERRRETVAELADEITQVIRPLTDQPLSLFGHSLGATVAFEVARRMEADDIELAHLFVSSRRAPDLNRNEHVYERGDQELIKQIRSLSGTAPDVFDDPDMTARVLPAIRSDYKAAETYVYAPGPKLTCPVTALIGDADPMVSADEVTAWSKHTDGTFELRIWPGGHFYLDAHATEVIAEISAAMVATRST